MRSKWNYFANTHIGIDKYDNCSILLTLAIISPFVWTDAPENPKQQKYYIAEELA